MLFHNGGSAPAVRITSPTNGVTVGKSTKVYVLAAIEHGTRRIRILGATEHPIQSWVVQQARNLLMDLEDAKTSVKFVLHDRDASFTAAFDAVFRAAGVRAVRSAVQAPPSGDTA